MTENRSIALYIVLTIITCGIFGLYWLVVLNNDVNTVSREQNPMSGGVVVLLTIVTCGIYGYYWSYNFIYRSCFVNFRYFIINGRYH